MRRMMFLMVALTAMMPFADFIVSDAFGKEIWVSNNQSIQKAIDESATGDMIIVKQGTYSENLVLNFDGAKKKITLKSEKNYYTEKSGIGETIIDGGGKNHCVSFTNGNNSELFGFTIQNGKSQRGGGVYISSSSPSIRDCVVQNNNAVEMGGGIYSYNSTVDIEHTVIQGNIVIFNGGGGISCDYNSYLTILDCNICNNRVQNDFGSGGGINATESSAFSLSDSTLTTNYAYYGGGVASYGYNPQNIVGDLLIDNCNIISNQASSGAGLFLASSPVSAVVQNSLIAGNTANSSFGGIYYYSDNSTISYSTIADNKSNEESSYNGIFLHYNSTIVANNLIVWGCGNAVAIGSSSSVLIKNSDIEGEKYAADNPEGNIDKDPKFAEKCNYYLSYDSPCRESSLDTKIGYMGWKDYQLLPVIENQSVLQKILPPKGALPPAVYQVTGNMTDGFTLGLDKSRKDDGDGNYGLKAGQIVIGDGDGNPDTNPMSLKVDANGKGFYPFYLADVNNGVTTAFYDYWTAKGVTAASTEPYKAHMWKVINVKDPVVDADTPCSFNDANRKPAFYLYVENAVIQLIDGPSYDLSKATVPMKWPADYPRLPYTFSGMLISSTEISSGIIDMTITVKDFVPEIKSLSLKYAKIPKPDSNNDIQWAPVSGDYTKGYEVTLNPDNDYYLGAETVTFVEDVKSGAWEFKENQALADSFWLKFTNDGKVSITKTQADKTEYTIPAAYKQSASKTYTYECENIVSASSPSKKATIKLTVKGEKPDIVTLSFEIDNASSTSSGALKNGYQFILDRNADNPVKIKAAANNMTLKDTTPGNEYAFKPVVYPPYGSSAKTPDNINLECMNGTLSIAGGGWHIRYSEYPAGTYLYKGTVTGDNGVKSDDIYLVFNIGYEPLAVDGDMSGNGKRGLEDAIYILQEISGIWPPPAAGNQ